MTIIITIIITISITSMFVIISMQYLSKATSLMRPSFA